jgi:hypothetical protein
MNQMKNETLSEFPKSEQSTYYYYIGRLSLFEGQMSKAYEYLSLSYSIALSYKGSNSAAILQQILKYLMIARIYHGQMPREQFLRRVRLEEYIGLVKSVQEVYTFVSLGGFGSV